MRSKAFTLIELAIVLVVLGVLLSLGIRLFGTMVKDRKYQETQKILSKARDALVGYVMSTGALPCPDADDDGQADGTGGTCTCTWPNCYLPEVTLGVRGLDAYRSRIYYQVDNNFTAFGSVRGFCVHAPFLSPSIKVTDGTNAYYVVAVVLSPGLTDADNNGSKLDLDNSDGSQFMQESQQMSSNYDDILKEVSKQWLINKVCDSNLRRIKIVITSGYLCYHGKTYDSSDGNIFLAMGDTVQENYCGYSSGR